MRHLALYVAQLRAVRETRRHERLGQRRAGRDGDRHAVTARPAAAVGREELAAQHVHHGARHDVAVDGGRDAHREQRDAVDEVDRSVERIDDPLEARTPRRGAALLGQDSRLGCRAEQGRPHALLGAQVGLGDHVGRR
jgi:hypothetical protein